jgi:LPS sulfotransferase NodH
LVPEKTPFIVLASARSGSTHFAYLLDQHPRIKQYQELFHPNPGSRARVNGRVARDADDGRRFVRWVFEESSDCHDAIGFKLMYKHAREGSLSTAWSYLAALGELRVLHMVRNNLFEALVSRRLAEMHQAWHRKPRYSGAEYPSVRIAPSDCRDYFDDVLENRVWVLGMLRYSHITTIYYEALRDDQDAAVAVACSALGVSAFQPKAVLAKIECLPMSRRVSNYDELKVNFIGTKYERYFDC